MNIKNTYTIYTHMYVYIHIRAYAKGLFKEPYGIKTDYKCYSKKEEKNRLHKTKVHRKWFDTISSTVLRITDEKHC